MLLCYEINATCCYVTRSTVHAVMLRAQRVMLLCYEVNAPFCYKKSQFIANYQVHTRLVFCRGVTPPQRVAMLRVNLPWLLCHGVDAPRLLRHGVDAPRLTVPIDEVISGGTDTRKTA